MTSINTRVLLCLTVALSVVSCTHPETAQDNALSKLEQLHCVRPDSVMDYYDLSGDSLTEFPDLSRYVIRSLDLSHNQLDTFILRYLPTGLEKLNLSYNRLEGKLDIGKEDAPTLEELDVSHNSLLEFFCRKPLRRLVLAHNMLDYNVWADVSQYFDVSHNRYFCPSLLFDLKADTVVSEGLADKEPLEYYVSKARFFPPRDEKRSKAYGQLTNMAADYIEYYIDNPDTLRKVIRLLDTALRAKNGFYAKDAKAMILAHLGEREAALKIMEQTNAKPGWLATEATVLLSKGIAFELNGQKEEAQRLYRKAYDILRKTVAKNHRFVKMGNSLGIILWTEYMAALFLMDGHCYTAEEAWKKVYGPQAILPDTIKYNENVQFTFNMDMDGLKSKEDRLLTLWRNRLLIR